MSSRSNKVQIKTPDGVLAFYLKEILFNLRYTIYEINKNIDEYLNRKGITANFNKHHKRSQIQDDITSKQITIKTFFKILDVFQVTSIEFRVRLTFTSNFEYLYTEKYEIRDKEENAPQLFSDISSGLIEQIETDPSLEYMIMTKQFSKPWKTIRAHLNNKKMTIKIFMRCLEYMRADEFHFNIYVESMNREPFEVKQGFYLRYQL